MTTNKRDIPNLNWNISHQLFGFNSFHVFNLIMIYERGKQE